MGALPDQKNIDTVGELISSTKSFNRVVNYVEREREVISAQDRQMKRY
jgi:hypothetical protein